MSEDVRVTNCAGLGWLALWTFLIWFTLIGINNHLRSIAKSQRQIAAVYPVIETDPNTIIHVIKGPAALAYQGCNGHTYWFGIASHNRICHKLRRTSDKALEDAEKLEEKNDDRVTSDNQ